jgi:hypothetical protein
VINSRWLDVSGVWLCLEFLMAMSVGTLIFVLAVALFGEVLAEFSLVLGLDLVLRVLELAVVPLVALVLQKVPADTLPLQLEELLHLLCRADPHFAPP